MPIFEETDSFLLMAIACEQDTEGADLARIRINVDGIERMGLSDDQAEGGLARLLAAGYITRDGDKYILSEMVSAGIPRSAKDSLSLQRRYWNPLLRKLGLPTLFV